MKRNFRKPLVVMTPKSLLRLKAAVSPLDEFVNGRFQEVLDDTARRTRRASAAWCCAAARSITICWNAAAEAKANDIAIVRVEQFYPFPEEQLKRVLAALSQGGKEWVWVQEESQNMGGWSFMEPRLRALGYPVEYVGRDASASPATGSLAGPPARAEGTGRSGDRRLGPASGPRRRHSARATRRRRTAPCPRKSEFRVLQF